MQMVQASPPARRAGVCRGCLRTAVQICVRTVTAMLAMSMTTENPMRMSNDFSKSPRFYRASRRKTCFS